MNLTRAEVKFFRFIFWSLLVSLGAIFVKFYFFRAYPVIPDEISYRILTSRYLLDGHERITIWAPCVSAYAIKLPFLLEIGTYIINPIAHIHSFSSFRYIPIAVLLAGGTCLGLMAKRLKLSIHSPDTRIAALLLIVFLMSIQTFSPASAGLFLLRGEYALFLAMPLLLLAICKNDMSLAPRWSWYVVAILLFLASCCLHPKTLFFIPFFAAFVWLLFWKASILLRIVLIAPLVIAGKQCMEAAKQWVTCPEYPQMSSINQALNVNPLDILKGKASAISDFLSNNTLSRFIYLIRERALFSRECAPGSDCATGYFPKISSENGWNYIGYPLANAYIILCLVLVIVGVAAVMAFMIRHRKKGMRDLAEYGVIKLACIGVVCTSAHLAFNRCRHLIDFATWIYLFSIFSSFGLMAILSIRSKSTSSSGLAVFRFRPFCFFLAAFFLFGNLSEAVLLNHVLYRPIRHGWSGIGVPVLGVDRETEQKRVKDFLPRCGNINNKSRFMVDDKIYPYVEVYPKPVPLTWTWFLFAQKMEPNLPIEAQFTQRWALTLDFMKKNEITAVVGSCPSFGINMPENLLVRESDDWSHSFCCLRAPD